MKYNGKITLLFPSSNIEIPVTVEPLTDSRAGHENAAQDLDVMASGLSWRTSAAAWYTEVDPYISQNWEQEDE